MFMSEPEKIIKQLHQIRDYFEQLSLNADTIVGDKSTVIISTKVAYSPYRMHEVYVLLQSARPLIPLSWHGPHSELEVQFPNVTIILKK
jgi:hypothetical protein